MALRLLNRKACRYMTGEMIMRKLAVLIVLAQLLFAATTGMVVADQLSRSVTTHGLTVHFGIVSADKAPSVPEEGSISGDTTAGHSLASYHLVVALFDARTGARIDNAVVIARMTAPVSKARPKVQIKRLPVLTANGMVTYGSYFDMPWAGRYRIDLSVRRRDSADTVHVRLNYEHSL
ncbi:hypothetical protein C5615_29760 [Burkholderia cepacia]|uniref:YtkA-like domain-containing protein n=1 Tax=Burkholderia cepacia TaxID=292 RepID=A0A2S8IEB0_BURCE|nr:hypothetical protein [Burkholderia cepacia]PQP13100.1 hypothetical protein C5615_29760 [Burkholderia cepacia]HDR9510447.1 hypothetical protein [Burkholderia cepacia]